MLRIWFDALTGKQSLLMHYLAIKFEGQGHEVLITSRPYSIDRSNTNFERLNRQHISVGVYGGAKLKDKLIHGSKRIIELTEIVSKYEPDLLIAFPSPDAFRTAFGLGIPSIQINDTPHASAPARLTISLSNALVFSEAIKVSDFSQYGVTKFYTYKGVDEILWIKQFTQDDSVLHHLNLEKQKYVVLRCEESKAGYFQRMFPSIKPGETILVEFIEELQAKYSDEFKIVVFPRYPEQERLLSKFDVIIPEQSVDTLNLFYFAKIVMTAGGTMGREAALLGTPTIYSFPIELAVNTYINRFGFPLHHIPNILEIPKHLIDLLNSSKMNEEKRQLLISKFETPYEGIQKALEEIEI